MSAGILSLRFSPTHMELRPASQPVFLVGWRENGEKERKRKSEQARSLAVFFAFLSRFSLYSLKNRQKKTLPLMTWPAPRVNSKGSPLFAMFFGFRFFTKASEHEETERGKKEKKATSFFPSLSLSPLLTGPATSRTWSRR